MAHERILLVDDNAVNLKVTTALLSWESYQIATAASAEEALEMIPQVQPQLILTDVRLAGMDGLELARRVKSHPEWRSIPVIALTATPAAEGERWALDAGCDAYLTKPVASPVLREAVRKYLCGKPRPEAVQAVDEEIIAPLRYEFLRSGIERCGQLLAKLPETAPTRTMAPYLDYEGLERALHGWAGVGGTIGFPHITDKAREGEALLKQPLERVSAELRGLMVDLLEQFKRGLQETRSPERVSKPVAPPNTAEEKPDILVCDDDPVVLKLIKATLEANGMACRTAHNGRAAFSSARNNPPDAVVLDINMPALDGFQVLDELRRLRTTRRLKVMLLTARQEAEDITRGVYHGADDYMIKPFDPGELVQRIKGLLAKPER